MCLTTRHGKQKALELPFRRGLGVRLEVCPADTDRLGTFSGEVERPADALETCRRKALIGLEQTGLALGLASEASFGPHPAVPLLAVGQELLVFLDRERELMVVEQRLELRTNYSQLQLARHEDPSGWLRQIGFPGHGVIARPAASRHGLVVKGLHDPAGLHEAIGRCRGSDPHGQVLLETDMRAHHNPTRLRSIRRLGVALVRRLGRLCPGCGSPGWGLLDTVAGLPCGWCGSPTELALAELWGCQQCGARERLPRRDGLERADPGGCPSCNP